MVFPAPQPLQTSSKYDIVFMRLAADMAALATCTSRRSVGAVIVSNRNYLISTGYNGSPHGMVHCDTVGCIIDDSGSCLRAVHAEMNAILQCARRGVSLEGATMYCTHFPCPRCALHICQSGLAKVIWNFGYHDMPKFQLANELLISCGISVEQYQG